MASPPVENKAPHLVVGIDFGTTATSVSCAVAELGLDGSERVDLKKVRAVDSWPHDELRGASKQVPTKLW